MLATKKESAPGPGIRCGEGFGSQLLFNAYRYVVEGGSIPSRFAASSTVFIPKSSSVDDNNLIRGAAKQRSNNTSQTAAGGVRVIIPTRQETLCVGGPHRGRVGTKWPTETALTPSSRVCPDPRLGSVSCGPRPNWHEEH